MLKPIRFIAIFICALALTGIAEDRKLFLDESLPVDPQVTMGQLQNGLTYYIRVNKKPENRAEVRLVVNAGSVLENDDQQGYAHLGEHMAFNGTGNFKKHELVDYLESIGMKFGPEVNAYTGFDQVVYMLQLPTDSLEQFATGFQILEDWAHLVSYEDEEIDKERGVVIEEWRLGRGASARMRDKYFPILFKNSRYAERLPIGKLDILQSNNNDAVRRFYHDWYRPDLLAVIAVGDFDPDYVKSLIEKHFAHLKTPANAPERIYFPVPEHKEPLFSIVSDVEASRSSISVYFKREVQEVKTIGDYRQNLVEALYSQMINNRLDELRRQAEPPFLYAASGKGRIARTKDAYYLAAGVNDGGVVRGLDALFTEALRVKKYGFVQSELDRAKTALLRSYERAYAEREKTESGRYAREYVNNFLENETIPGIENEYHYATAFVPAITLQEVNGIIDDFITDGNRVVIVQMPEKDDLIPPSEQELEATMVAAMQKELLPYEDNVSDEPLVAETLPPGDIVHVERIDNLDVTKWTLSNGIQVLLKPTDFKNDEIRLLGKSWGGTSLGHDEDWPSIRAASAVINQSGWGQFDAISLRNKLSGKIVSLHAGIGELSETISANASPQDIETMFQLIYLAFTAPRRDEQAFQSYKARLKGYLENQGANPEAVFADTVSAVMSSYHPRRMPFVTSDLDKMNLDTMYDFYRARYDDAGDFTFFIVGSFDVNRIRPLVVKYLGSLPNLEQRELWRDINVTPPQGRVERIVRKGLEPKARVRLEFTGDYKFSRRNNYAFYSLRDVLNIRLREIVREEKSGTYGISVSAWPSRIPKQRYRFSISFGCSPDRVDELTDAVFSVIDSIKTVGVSIEIINKVKEIDHRAFETDIEKNSYWLSKLEQYHRFGWDYEDILAFPELVKELSPEIVQESARAYLDQNNVARFVLLPEK